MIVYYILFTAENKHKFLAFRNIVALTVLRGDLDLGKRKWNYGFIQHVLWKGFSQAI